MRIRRQFGEAEMIVFFMRRYGASWLAIMDMINDMPREYEKLFIFLQSRENKKVGKN